MNASQRRVIIALDGIPVGQLEATDNAYRFSYFQDYESRQTSIPISISYPLHQGPKEYAFAGALPPYFSHLLPEGWLKDVAENARLPMDTPLEKLSTLCRENIGALEIYQADIAENFNYETIYSSIQTYKSQKDLSSIFLEKNPATEYTAWKNCSRCHEPLPSEGYNANYHDDCSLQFFGTKKAPFINASTETLIQIAEDQLRRRESLTGVQPKFSAVFKDNRDKLVETSFIIKPEPVFARKGDGISYAHTSVAELAAMHFAELLEMNVAETALIYLQGNQPAIISKRFDRRVNGKIHIEDAAQALGTRDKYQGSHEKIAKIIKSIPNVKQARDDLLRFYKIVIFNFIIGNSDGHLKNFSFIHFHESGANGFRLAPFYDILPVKLFALNDPDQLALTIEGQRSKLKRRQFLQLAIKLSLNIKILDEFVEELEDNIEKFYETFHIFGIPEVLIERLKLYCENQILLLRS